MTERKLTWKEYLSDPWRNLEKINPGLLENPEVKDVIVWYEEMANSLPLMEAEDAPLTDGKDWIAIGQGSESEGLLIDEVRRADNKFYVLRGRKLTKYKDRLGEEVMFSWTQPVKEAIESPLSLKLYGEEVILPINGVLGLLGDNEGRILMTIDQEATSECPNFAIVRLPIQASAGKMALMKEGKKDADRQLSELLEILGMDVEEMLNKAEVIISIPPEDTNLDIKHNVLLIMPTAESESELHNKLAADEKRKWLTPIQQAAIGVARVTNNHTLAAMETAGGYTILRNC